VAIVATRKLTYPSDVPVSRVLGAKVLYALQSLMLEKTIVSPSLDIGLPSLAAHIVAPRRISCPSTDLHNPVTVEADDGIMPRRNTRGAAGGRKGDFRRAVFLGKIACSRRPIYTVRRTSVDLRGKNPVGLVADGQGDNFGWRATGRAVLSRGQRKSNKGREIHEAFNGSSQGTGIPVV
jgi:hypothetical protein